MSEWKPETVGNVVDYIKGFPFKSIDYKNKGIPIVKVKNFTADSIDISNCDFLAEEEQNKYSKYRLKENDVIIATVGSWLTNPNSVVGKTVRVPSKVNGGLLNQNAVRLRAKIDFDQRFLFYLLRHDRFKFYIVGTAQGSANQASITLNDIFNYDFEIPPLPEQKAIAHILGSLDDKIALNRQMNQTLEAMAQALFKSWFVDFDPVLDNALAAGNPIPDELEAMAEKRRSVIASAARQSQSKRLIDTNPELAEGFPSSFVFNETLGKWIPEGWEDVEVGDILKRLKISNRYKKDQVNEFGKVPVYEQGADILLGYHENEPDVDASIKDPSFIFGDHTCVMKLGISPFSISANVIVLKGNIRNTIWTYFGLQGVQSFEEYRRHWMELIVKSIVLPPVELCDKFQEFVKPFLQQKFETQKQIETLTQLRDRLLPELISGRVRVKESVK